MATSPKATIMIRDSLFIVVTVRVFSGGRTDSHHTS
jgi:hypothetical protein